jgi:ABC-type nitrate/sulfonate/bicarbonate transport system substrate-binding protein
MSDTNPNGWPPPNEILQAAAREMAASPLPLWARGPFYQAHQTLRTEAVSAYVAAQVEAARREEREAAAARALDINYLDESGTVSAASQNQALYTYHALMSVSDPGRTLARSIEEARAIRARGDA